VTKTGGPKATTEKRSKTNLPPHLPCQPADQVMSETTAWTSATGPTDPRIDGLFRQVFQVVFSDSPALKPNLGGGGNRR
jgi:hypothetical protein